MQYVKTTRRRKRGDGGQTLALPGTLQGFVQAPIAARASRLRASAGTRTSAAASKKGELLAEIETPEIDQQLSQAVAAREQTASSLGAGQEHGRRAGKRCARRTPSRSRSSTSAAARDAQARANLAAADANVQRLRQLEGVQARRRAVRGRDHAAQRRRRRPDRRGQRHGRALFVLAQTDPLRVYVQRAAVVCAAGQAGPEGGRDAGRAAGPAVQRRGRAHVGVDRRRHAHDAGRGRAAEQGRHAAARRLRAGRAAAAGEPHAVGARPTRCCSAARARAWRSSTRTAACTCSRSRSAATSAQTVEVLDGVGADRPAGAQPARLARRRRSVASRAAATAQRPAPRVPRRRTCRDARRLRGARALALGCSAAAPSAPTTSARHVDMPVGLEARGAVARRRARRRAAKGAWWQRFGDPQLDALRAAGARRQPDAGAASARLAQARAGVAATSAGLLPQRRPAARARRASGSRPTGRSPTTRRRTSRRCRTTSRLRSRVSYEVDLAGRVRRTIEGARASRRAVGRRPREHAAGAHAPSSRPTTSTCASSTSSSTCWRARSRCSAARSTSSTTRHDLGAASGLDVAQQQALLDNTLTQVDVLRRQRAQFEHAIATLTGTPAPVFTLAPDVRELHAAGDSARRAVRRAAAPARRRLGRARDGRRQRADRRRQGGVLSEHHPRRRASASRAASLGTLFDAPSLLWSLGVSVAQPLFDAGRLARQRRLRARRLRRRGRQLSAHGADRDAGGGGRHHRPGRARARRRAGAAWRSRARAACSTSRPRATKAASRPIST